MWTFDLERLVRSIRGNERRRIPVVNQTDVVAAVIAFITQEDGGLEPVIMFNAPPEQFPEIGRVVLVCWRNVERYWHVHRHVHHDMDLPAVNPDHPVRFLGTWVVNLAPRGFLVPRLLILQIAVSRNSGRVNGEHLTEVRAQLADGVHQSDEHKVHNPRVVRQFAEDRRSDLLKIATDAGFSENTVTFVSVFLDRADDAFRRELGSLAWKSFAWFMSEPENIVLMYGGQNVVQPSSLSDLMGN